MTGDIRRPDAEPPVRSRKVAWVIMAIFLGAMLVFGFFWLIASAMMFYE